MTPSMTITVASYQRRGPLIRLLRALDQQVQTSDDLRAGLDVVVVLDGSTDGSREAVTSGNWSVPVRVQWQPNRGLAAARNAGLASVAGEIVWFLDDDLVPSPGLLARHRRAHETDNAAVVVGPCMIPPDVAAPPALRLWWERFYREQAESGVITRFDRFTTANASAPVALIRSVGGWNETFVGYGLEDYELGLRLLAANCPIKFDIGAVAWHPMIPPKTVQIKRERSVGFNSAHLVEIHPEALSLVFPPPSRISKSDRLLRRLRLRRQGSLMTVSWAAFGLHLAATGIFPGVSRRADHLSRRAAYAAGVAKGDPQGALLERLLGY
jgi:glycosyltransferase involved in cell wall biosynthesis